MLTPRRLAVLLPLLAVLLSLSPSDAQPPDAADLLTLPIDRRAAALLEAAKEYLDARDWQTAIPALQRLVERDEDALAVFTVKGPDGRAIRKYVSARTEAQRLLAEMPAEGRKVYQGTYGRLAADLFAKAREDKDVAPLARVAQRYPLTDAGVEALREMAGRHFNASQYQSSAAAFELLLLRRQDLVQWSPESLFQAGLTFRSLGVRKFVIEKESILRAQTGKLQLQTS